MSEKPVHADQSLLEGIVQNDQKVIRKIYQDYLPRIKTFIKLNNGSDSDAMDMFQEAIIIMFRKAKDENMKLTSSFYSYLYGTCRHLWLRHQNKKVNNEVTIKDSMRYSIEDTFDVESTIIERERDQLFKEKLGLLTESCRSLLELFFAGVSMKEIVKKLGLSSENYARKKKFKCKEKLIEFIQADQRFDELKR